MAQYLKPPLRFHTNAPSQIAPRHRARHVSSQLAVDGSGNEHLLLHFYVESLQPEYVTNPNEPPSLSWTDLDVDAVVDWSKAQATTAIQSLKSTFAYLVGSPAQPQESSQPSPSTRRTDIGRPHPEASSGWRFAGLFSGLRSTSRSAQKAETSSHAQFVGGEVHADLVKDTAGNFQYRYLLVDFPREYFSCTLHALASLA